jgi:hypothetical protein
VEGKLFSRPLAETGLMVFELVIGNGGSFIVSVSMITVTVVNNTIGGLAFGYQDLIGCPSSPSVSHGQYIRIKTLI